MDDLVFIIGFRAVGKSTVGRLLARKLHYDFQDTDQLICQRVGMSIDAIVQNEGWDGFRAHERAVLQQTSTLSCAVISTGGGAILHQTIWQEIAPVAKVIWLKAEQETIVSRIQQDQNSQSQRPSLTGKELSQEVRQTLYERTPLYAAMAHHVADTEQCTPVEIVENLVVSLWNKS